MGAGERVNTRLYLVDDDEAIRRSLGLMLRLAGFDVTSFESGVAFLDGVERLPQGCILLDVGMPEMDGLEVQRELIRRGVEMPVIVMTGHGDIAVAVAALRAGADDFLEKPFERATLIAAIERASLRVCDAAAYDFIVAEAARTLDALATAERRVLDAFAQGLSNQAAGASLGLAVADVEMARAAIMAKLGATSLAQAIRFAYLASGRSGSST